MPFIVFDLNSYLVALEYQFREEEGTPLEEAPPDYTRFELLLTA